MKEYRGVKTCPYHVSAGGIIFREDGKVLVLYRNKSEGKQYHLPKGTMHYDETLETCALREVREESGHGVEVAAYLGATYRQWEEGGIAWERVNHYFALRHTGEVSQHDAEHDGYEWVTPEEAIKLFEPVHWKREDRIVERLVASGILG